MRNVRMLSTVFISALLLQSCVVIKWQLRNELKANRSSHSGQPCSANYFVSMRYVAYPDMAPSERMLQEYIKRTQDIFSKSGCIANHVGHEEGATFKIQIRVYQSEDFGMALVTGLSLGLIPSWSTTSPAYEFNFEDLSTKKANRYYVDKKTYGHLILFPITLLELLLDVMDVYDQITVYETALINFIENS